MFGVEPLLNAVRSQRDSDAEREQEMPVSAGRALVECFVVCFLGHTYVVFFILVCGRCEYTGGVKDSPPSVRAPWVVRVLANRSAACVSLADSLTMPKAKRLPLPAVAVLRCAQ